MRVGVVRRGLHHVHAVATLLLLASGWLVADADLRARLVGGYGREILQAHVWIGWALLAAPILALALAQRPLLRDVMRRLGPPDPVWTWRKVHLVGAAVLWALLIGTGVILWADVDLSRRGLDAALEIHVAATWAVVISIPLHLALARGKIAARTGELLGGQPPSVHADQEGNPVDVNR